MKVIRNILFIVVAVELAVSCYFLAERMGQTSPPSIDSRRLDPATAADLERIRKRISDGTSSDWRELAEAYLGNGYYVAAEQCFRYAAELDPEDQQALYGQGFCLERIGRTTKAIEVLRRTAATGDPQLARTCWYQIGRGFLREENAAEAEAAFRRISDFQPAAYQLAKLLIRSERADEAIPILERQLGVLPNSLKLLQLRRHAAEAVGDRELVIELRDREDRAEYQLVLEYGQSFISMFAARYGLSRILSNAMRLKTQGTLVQRKSALDDALRIIQPNSLWQYRSAFIAAAHVELGLNNPARAKELLSILQQRTQDGVDSRDLAAMIATAEGDHEAAYTIWKTLSDMKPTVPLHDRLSRTKAIRDQNVRDVHRGQSALLSGMDAWRRNRVDEARSYLSEAVRLLPTDERALFYMGEVHRQQGDIEDATAAFVRCLQQNPDHGRAIARMRQIKSD